MKNESEKINKAIEKYIRTCWILSDISSIQSEYDDRVLNEIRDIYNYSVSYPVDWENDSINELLKKFSRSLLEEYSFLSESAIKTLYNCFLYQWK